MGVIYHIKGLLDERDRPESVGMPRARFLESARLLQDFARDMGLTITLHPQGGVT